MKIAFMATATAIPDMYRKSADELFHLHGGNTGNVAFVSAIASHLKDEVNPVSWNAQAEELRQAGDIVVIACANQMGPHTDLARTARNLDQADLPILAIGLGAQADSKSDRVELQDGTRRWIEVIAAHSPGGVPNIGVRGEYTRQQLELFGLGSSASVMGCPSNFTNLSSDFPAEIDEQQQNRVTLIAAAVGHPFTASLGPIERQILDLVDATNGTCIVQHGASMIDLAMGEFDKIDPPLLEQTRRYFRPNLNLTQFIDWCRYRMLVFGDTNQWMTWVKRCDFVVGPRFHGIMLAIQAGVPAGCVAHDSRTTEMCETMAIPVRMHDSFDSPLTLDNLKEAFPFDSDHYRKTRAALADRYVGMLSAAGISIDPRLREVAGQTRSASS